MILSNLLYLVLVKCIWCIYIPNEIYPKGSTAKLTHHHNQTPKQISTDSSSDVLKNTNENYFPDVIYPTSILDITQPFFYRVNAQDQVLGPFSDDVKTSYKYISSNKGKNSNVNTEVSKVQFQVNLESCTENEASACKKASYEKSGEQDETLSSENIGNMSKEKSMEKIQSTCAPSSTSADKTDSLASLENSIPNLPVEDILIPPSHNNGYNSENVNKQIKGEVDSIILDLKSQEIPQNFPLDLEINSGRKASDIALIKDSESKKSPLFKQNITVDSHNFTSSNVNLKDSNEELPPLPVGCFESNNVTNTILTTFTDELFSLNSDAFLNNSPELQDIQEVCPDNITSISGYNKTDTELNSDEFLNNSPEQQDIQEVCPDNIDGYITSILGYNETDIYKKILSSSLQNGTNNDYDNNGTYVGSDDTQILDDIDGFFLDMIVSLGSNCDINDTISYINETNVIEPINDQTDNIEMNDDDADQENK